MAEFKRIKISQKRYLINLSKKINEKYIIEGQHKMNKLSYKLKFTKY